MAKAVRWDLIADPRGFQRGFREANRSADTFSRGIKRTAGLIGAAFAGVQVAGFLKDAITEAREAAKVTRQTNAVIKATGGVANVSAKDVDRLATSLMKKAGVDDDVIKAGQNMLLTFKGVRDEAGKNNDIFSQATTVALDMTAAMNQGVVTQEGLEASNIRLGKALNDPIKGIASLTKVGVTFTDQQKDQIKKLVESGDKMEAQKIILGELKTEYGGAAEAAADPWQKVIVAFDEVKESIGTALLGPMNNVADFITGTFIPAAEKWWKEHGPKVRESFRKLVTVLGEVWKKITDDLLPAFQEVASFVTKDLQPTIDDLTQTWKDNKDAIGGLKQTNDVSMDTWKKVAGFLANVMAKQVERLTTVVGLLARAWSAAAKVTNAAVTFIVVTFVSAFRTIVRGAATLAEALHLPIAKGLRAADRSMDSWVKDFNANLNKLDDEAVTIKLKSTFTPPPKFSMHSIVGAQEGMRIPGYGGGDRIPIMAEAGEAVVPKEAVRDHDFQAWAAGKRIPGFRFGGIIPHADTFSTTGMRNTQEGIDQRVGAKTAAGIQRNFRLLLDALGMGSGPGGWKWQMAVLRRQFPGISLISGFRPGAITATGNRSYHASGRAVDIPPVMGYFNWISANYGKRTKELIFSPAGSRQIHNGSPHMYTGVTRGDHWDHVHWAYDKGGMLPPGTSLATNNTGRPEPVGFDYDKMAAAFVAALEERPPAVYLDRQKVSRAVRDGDLWEARR